MTTEEVEKFAGQKVAVTHHTEPLPGEPSNFKLRHIAVMKLENPDYVWEEPTVVSEGILDFCGNGLVCFSNIQPPDAIYSGFNILQRNVVSIKKM